MQPELLIVASNGTYIETSVPKGFLENILQKYLQDRAGMYYRMSENLHVEDVD
jgi:hypothetical protein